MAGIQAKPPVLVLEAASMTGDQPAGVYSSSGLRVLPAGMVQFSGLTGHSATSRRWTGGPASGAGSKACIVGERCDGARRELIE